MRNVRTSNQSNVVSSANGGVSHGRCIRFVKFTDPVRLVRVCPRERYPLRLNALFTSSFLCIYDLYALVSIENIHHGILTILL